MVLTVRSKTHQEQIDELKSYARISIPSNPRTGTKLTSVPRVSGAATLGAITDKNGGLFLELTRGGIHGQIFGAFTPRTFSALRQRVLHRPSNVANSSSDSPP